MTKLRPNPSNTVASLVRVYDQPVHGLLLTVHDIRNAEPSPMHPDGEFAGKACGGCHARVERPAVVIDMERGEISASAAICAACASKGDAEVKTIIDKVAARVAAILCEGVSQQ